MIKNNTSFLAKLCPKLSGRGRKELPIKCVWENRWQILWRNYFTLQDVIHFYPSNISLKTWQMNIKFIHLFIELLKKSLQRIFSSTKWLGRYQVQASRFMAQTIVLVIINAMISNDWKLGIMDESKKKSV